MPTEIELVFCLVLITLITPSDLICALFLAWSWSNEDFLGAGVSSGAMETCFSFFECFFGALVDSVLDFSIKIKMEKGSDSAL